ncbi:MAG: alpha/beta hydrolase [archaeon]
MKRVFIIHGWEGYPEEGWFPWLKQELESRGVQVAIPAMPNPQAPTIIDWTTYLAEQVGIPDKETFFVGHSIGCQAILRYLETLPNDTKIGGTVFVAGWIHLTPTSSNDPVALPWLETPLQWEIIRRHVDTCTAIFSDNDEYVPLQDAQIFEEKLNAEIIIEYGKKHFSGSDNVTELPAALNALLHMIP